MSNYVKTTNFAAKDALLTGNPSKLIKGTEIGIELDNVATATSTKANKIAGSTNNNLIMQDASGDLVDSTIGTDGAGIITATLVGNVTGDLVGNVTGNATTATTSTTATGVTGTGVITSTHLALSSVGPNELVANAVGDSVLSTTSSQGNVTVAAGSQYTLPDGFYMIGSTVGMAIEVSTSAGWRPVGTAGEGATVWSDGSTTRLNNTTGSGATSYWRKLS